jgi:hypothetical protein
MCVVKLGAVRPGIEQDTLIVNGLCVTHNVILLARGWVSATEQHYDADAYCEGDGSHELALNSHDKEAAQPVVCSNLHRADDAVARPMTQDEIKAYALGLLVTQNPQHQLDINVPKSLYEDGAILDAIQKLREANESTDTTAAV